MPIKFTDGNVEVTGPDANALAGLAIVGLVTTAVVSWKVGYFIGSVAIEFGSRFVTNYKERRKQ